MAKPRMDLPAFVGKLLQEHDGDVLREGVLMLAHALMDAEVTELVGAERHERTDERTGYRNGSRTRSWDTRVGTIELAVPKVRPGSHYRRCCSRGGGPNRRCARGGVVCTDGLLVPIQRACHNTHTRSP